MRARYTRRKLYGKRFGNLTVIDYDGKHRICVCSCGRTTRVHVASLKRQVSCGRCDPTTVLLPPTESLWDAVTAIPAPPVRHCAACSAELPVEREVELCIRCATHAYDRRYAERAKVLKRARYAKDPQRFRDAQKRWLQKHPDTTKRMTLRRYGLTLESYNAMLAAQSNLCALCGRPFDVDGNRGSRPSVDHDHATGEVRAVIHIGCNMALGLFQDDPELLYAAIAYLAKYGAQRRTA